jgi:hypothetical protein
MHSPMSGVVVNMIMKLVSLSADRTPHYQKKEGLIQVEEGFSLMNLLTSKVSQSVLEHQMKNIWRLAVCFGNTYTCGYTHPSRLCLSGTPLNEALISLHQILPKFQKKTNFKRFSVLFLLMVKQVTFLITLK